VRQLHCVCSCWAFEDAPAGVKAAKAAGMFVFAVPDARISRDLYAAADVVLDSIASFKLAEVLPA
jgi:beta-phosphoglucomutase-like phosphatase (HAD superfamily)